METDPDDPGTASLFGHLTPVQRRAVNSASAIMQDDPDGIGFQHTVLAQTCMPYL